jgi:hypothetical protein
MEPLSQVHDYRGRRELNAGALLEGTQDYRWCLGPEPIGRIAWEHELRVVPFSGEWAA